MVRICIRQCSRESRQSELWTPCDRRVSSDKVSCSLRNMQTGKIPHRGKSSVCTIKWNPRLSHSQTINGAVTNILFHIARLQQIYRLSHIQIWTELFDASLVSSASVDCMRQYKMALAVTQTGHSLYILFISCFLSLNLWHACTIALTCTDAS